MKSLILMMALFVVAIVFSTVAFAGSPQTGQMGYQCGVAQNTYTGQITSMNRAGNRIVVNGVEGDKGFVVSNATPDSGLQMNERVTVNYGEKNGRLVASCVTAPQPYVLPKELEEHFRAEVQQS